MEALVRGGTFGGILMLMLLWEVCRPRRRLTRPRQERWSTNLGLTLLNTVLVRVTVGGVAYTDGGVRGRPGCWAAPLAPAARVGGCGGDPAGA